MSVLASQVTGIATVSSTICCGAHQRKHQSSATDLRDENPPVTGNMENVPFDDVIMNCAHGPRNAVFLYFVWQPILPIYIDIGPTIVTNLQRLNDFNTTKQSVSKSCTYPMKLKVKDKILCSRLCKLIANYLVIYVGNICLKSDLIFMEENISLKLENL